MCLLVFQFFEPFLCIRVFLFSIIFCFFLVFHLFFRCFCLFFRRFLIFRTLLFLSFTRGTCCNRFTLVSCCGAFLFFRTKFIDALLRFLIFLLGFFVLLFCFFFRFFLLLFFLSGLCN